MGSSDCAGVISYVKQTHRSLRLGEMTKPDPRCRRMTIFFFFHFIYFFYFSKASCGDEAITPLFKSLSVSGLIYIKED